MIVDEMHEEHPELLKDQYWEEVVPKDLPYTVASEHYRKDEPKGSAEHYKVKEADAVYANIMNPNGKRSIHDDVYADYVSIERSVETFWNPIVNNASILGECWHSHGGETQQKLVPSSIDANGLNT